MAKGSSAQINTVSIRSKKGTRKQLLVKGIVQGVGFRPFIYRIACEGSLAGFVRNTSRGVEIELEGTEGQLELFLERMHSELPPLAEIDSVEITEMHPLSEQGPFQIISSHAEVKGDVRIPTDIKVCADCQLEIVDPLDRHYYYPLTNCTNCGPRFTVIKDVPYDRKMTTMAPFPMCPDCEREYNDPLDRRFHAQPTACPACGPKTKLLTREGELMVEGNQGEQLFQVFEQARTLLKEGNIIAVKGIGGFHFVCHADDDQAVKKLRERKRRPSKPLALMAKDMHVIKNKCFVNAKEEQVLSSAQAPIVIVDKKDSDDFAVVAPSMNSVGVMLPYAPLHQLLFATDAFDWLVMTSANPSNMPITIDNQEAVDSLVDFVDYYLVHEREIEQRCDDSLVRIINNRQVNIRRSRGLTPEQITVPIRTDKIILAVGGEMKNVFGYMKEDKVILSQHIGEIDSWEGRQNFLASIGHFERLFDLEPDMVAYDKHPSYQVSEIARLLPYDNKVEIQHHHAHMASCMAEHGVTGKTLGIILDGTGYGDDETLWGSEFLVGDYTEFTRVAHGLTLPVVGGERAIKEPWRMAVAILHLVRGKDGLQIAAGLWPDKKQEINIIEQMLDKEVQVVYSSGTGRLFDGISALLGISNRSTYEGEAAIQLATCAERYHNQQASQNQQVGYYCGQDDSVYPYQFTNQLHKPLSTEADTLQALASNATGNGQAIIDWLPMVDAIITDRLSGVKIEEIAYKFHGTFAKAIAELALYIVKTHSVEQVAVSGGTWHNELILEAVINIIEASGVTVYSHEKVPTNDGGIALGQAVIAAAMAARGSASL